MECKLRYLFVRFTGSKAVECEIATAVSPRTHEAIGGELAVEDAGNTIVIILQDE